MVTRECFLKIQSNKLHPRSRGSFDYRNGRFFHKIEAREHSSFREYTFLWQNVGIRAVFFSWKIGKKDIISTFLAHNIVWFWENIRFLNQILACQQGLFNLIKKKHEYRVFERIDIFWHNMGMRAMCFLENWRFFDKIWAWEQWFFQRNRKKRHTVDFVGP